MTKPARDLRLVGEVLSSAFASLFFYILLHEGGHALVGLVLGGQLNEFTHPAGQGSLVIFTAGN